MRTGSAEPILLVEDDPNDEELTRGALQACRVANPIEVARDGAEALARLLGTGPLPILVILDLKLPKLDGLEVLRRLRACERTRRLPVIVFTSSNTERDVLEAYGCGCNSYVRKPVDFAQFEHAVKQLGLYWGLLNEPPPGA